MAGKGFTSENRLLIGVIEAEAGTAEDLTGIDATIRTRGLEITEYKVDYDEEDSKFQNGDHTNDEAIPTARRGTFGFGVKFAPSEVHYDNSATDTITKVVNPVFPFMRGAGFKATETIPTDEATQDGYTEYVPTVEADFCPMTLGLYDVESSSVGGSLEYIIAGAMSTLKIGFAKAGDPFLAAFSFEGKAMGTADKTKAEAPVFDDDNALGTVAFNSLNTSVLVEEINRDGTSAGNSPIDFCVNSANIDTGLTLADIGCQKGGEGLKHKYVATRKPMFDIDPLVTSVAEFDFWRGITEAKLYQITVTHQASATAPKMIIIIPRAQLKEAGDVDDNGIRRKGYVFRPLRNKAKYEGTVENDYIIRVGATNVIAL